MRTDRLRGESVKQPGISVQWCAVHRREPGSHRGKPFRAKRCLVLSEPEGYTHKTTLKVERISQQRAQKVKSDLPEKFSVQSALV